MEFGAWAALRGLLTQLRFAKAPYRLIALLPMQDKPENSFFIRFLTCNIPVLIGYLFRMPISLPIINENDVPFDKDHLHIQLFLSHFPG